jgi:leucyl aminopeptidase (aminopeptidase T)
MRLHKKSSRTVRVALNSLSEFADKIAKVHMDVAARTTEMCFNPLKELHASQRQARKTHDKEMERCAKTLAAEMAMVDKVSISFLPVTVL